MKKDLTSAEKAAVHDFINSFERITLRPGDVRRATVVIRYDPTFTFPYWRMFEPVSVDSRQFIGYV